jgi:hypothetical protein
VARPVTPGRVRAARILAVSADLLQIAVFPAFSQGLLSPANDVLDLAVGVAMVVLLGWHWAFLPTLLSEFIPFWDLVPTWTAAVLIVTRGAAGEDEKPETVAKLAPPADTSRR